MDTVINNTSTNSILSETEVPEVIVIKCQDCTFYIYISIGVAGIVILIILIINLIVCCCCCKRKRRKRKKPNGIQIPASAADPNEIIIQQQQQLQKQATVENGNIKTENSKSKIQNGASKPKTPTKATGMNTGKENTLITARDGNGKKVATAAAGIPSSTYLNTRSTQPSLSLDITQPKTESEMTPDELEYLAFSILDSGKRFRIFNTAVKMAEKIAESHGFWINDRDPTVPGDEEAWLQKEADNIVRTCVEIHGVPVPDFGANKSEYLDFIERHSLREIYQIALYTEVDDITRLFFLNAVIERFREIVRKLPPAELEKCQHPIPMLFRIYKEHPDIFEFKPKKHEKIPKKPRK